jgi:hypothetical protein
MERLDEAICGVRRPLSLDIVDMRGIPTAWQWTFLTTPI